MILHDYMILQDYMIAWDDIDDEWLDLIDKMMNGEYENWCGDVMIHFILMDPSFWVQLFPCPGGKPPRTPFP